MGTSRGRHTHPRCRPASAQARPTGALARQNSPAAPRPRDGPTGRAAVGTGAAAPWTGPGDTGRRPPLPGSVAEGPLTCHRVPVQVVEHVAHAEDAGGGHPGAAEARRLVAGGRALGVLAGRRRVHPARQGLHLALSAPAAAAPLAVFLLLLIAGSEPPAAARAAAGGAVAFQAHHGLRGGQPRRAGARAE